MELKIGQVSKMTGLSSSGIRFLEEEGIIVPSNGRKGIYRNYDVSNVSDLLDFRNYRECGFSLDEAANMIKECEIDDANYAFGRECDEIVKNIMQMQRKIVFLRRRQKDVAMIKGRKELLEVVKRPALVYYALNEGDEISEWPEHLGFEIPYADSSLYLETIDMNANRLVPKWSIAIETDDIVGYSFMNNKKVGYAMEHKAIHTIIEVNDDLTIDNKELERVYAYLNENHYSVERLITKRIVSIKEDGVKKRFDHLWIDFK